MVRSASLRRLLIGLFLVSGLFAQFQTVFACELMGGGERYVCCCHEHGDSGCPMGGGCHNQHNSPDSDCCAVTSYQAPPGSDALVSDTQAQQIALLEAPQPPPALPFSPTAFEPPNPLPALLDPAVLPPGYPGTLTYLLTRRIRV